MPHTFVGAVAFFAVRAVQQHSVVADCTSKNDISGSINR